jgi:transglutaminase-like putative cysteine protease
MSEWNIGCMRRAGGFMGTMAILIVGVYAVDILSPSAIAIARDMRQAPTASAPASAPNGHESEYSHALLRIRHHLRILSGRTDARRRIPNRAERHASRAALRRWNGQLQGFDAQAKAQFAATGRMIKDKHLPGVIQERYAQALAKYRERFAALKSDLDAIDRAPDDAAAKAKAEAALQWLTGKHLRHTQAPLDMGHLPFSRLKADPNRKPFTKKSQFIAAGLYSNPSARFASIGPFDISQMPSAQNPAYLAATTEVTLTPDIVAQASALNGNPVAIYNWVRNNIQWQPTWGAIQTASQTLSSHSGNAFDIASLTIALLRASGIPARYVVGTINVSADQFRNWAGGFQSINSAIQFASAGGIPITGITTAAGQITEVQMEHVWVEAAVDFIPSRGAVNRSADTWVPLDPSFKQISVQPGIDIKSASGLDFQSIVNNYLASGTVDSTDGYVSGLNEAILQQAQTDGLQALSTYIQQNEQNATVADVLGGRAIVPVQSSVLPASLPYAVTVVGARDASLPSTLEQQITFALGTEPDGSPAQPLTFPWAQLNNQRVTLSFQPATSADVAAFQALLPPQPWTTSTQLPLTLPAYLINVIPVLTVDGNVVMSGAPMQLGDAITFYFAPAFVGRGVYPNTYSVIAGSSLSVAVVAGTVSPAEIAAAQTRLAAVATTLQGTATTPVPLTRETVMNDLFHAGVLSYYGELRALADEMGSRQNAYYELAAGVGTFGYEPKVQYLLGIPRELEPGDAIMNIPVTNIIGTDAPAAVSSTVFTEEIGALQSTLESVVPGETLATSAQPTPGISAEAAMALALAQGQRIYGVTTANWPTIMPQIQASEVESADISDALAAGDEVIVHTGTVSVPGWTGSGYIIIDPATGEGAYKISGGANGGAKQLESNFMLAVLGVLGYVDGAIDHAKDVASSWSYSTYQELVALERVQKWLGPLALAASLYDIYENGTSPWSDVGQMSIETLAYALTSELTAAALSSAFLALTAPYWATIVVTVVLAVVIEVAAEHIEDDLFTYIPEKPRKAMYAYRLRFTVAGAA